jgi:hypothetical protein
MEITSRVRPGALNAGDLELRLERYSSISDHGVSSPPVELGMYTWAVDICPNGCKPSSAGHLSCFLINLNGQDLIVSATFSLLDRSGSKQATRQFLDEKLFKWETGGCTRIISSQELARPSRDLLVDDVLRIRIEIHSAGEHPADALTCAQDSLYLYYGFNPSQFTQSGCVSRHDVYPTDVRICTSTSSASSAQGVGAHKYVLTLRSPVFRTMFRSGMKEASGNTIEISDFPEVVVQAFVRFLYEDRCAKSVLQEHAVQVWHIADKYQVAPLSVLCEHYLIGTLTAASAIELLLLAEEYVIPDLRTEALSFIRDNLRTVVAQARFPDLPGVVVKDILQVITAR